MVNKCGFNFSWMNDSSIGLPSGFGGGLNFTYRLQSGTNRYVSSHVKDVWAAFLKCNFQQSDYFPHNEENNRIARRNDLVR